MQLHLPSNDQRGFTLIELLVVIAIIGILSAVVLAALGQSKGKGNDAAVKSNLTNARKQAEIFYDTNGGQYVVTVGGATDVCSASASVNGTPGVYAMMKAAADAEGLTLNTSRTSASGAANPAACHACTTSDASCSSLYRGGWASLVKMSDGTAFCVDYTGFSGTTTLTALGSGDTQCNG